MKHNTFVPARRENLPVVVEVERGWDLPAPPVAEAMPHASYEDRARGFSVATAPLAGITGLVVALLGVVAFGVPALSVAALLLALAGFAAVWLLAYVAHVLISPDGALFAHVVLTWSYLKREQLERHRRYADLYERMEDRK